VDQTRATFQYGPSGRRGGHYESTFDELGNRNGEARLEPS
jgi:hypothetical protein